MVSGRNGTKVNIKDKEGKELNQVDQFKYIGGHFQRRGWIRNSSKSKSEGWVAKMERTWASDSR